MQEAGSVNVQDGVEGVPAPGGDAYGGGAAASGAGGGSSGGGGFFMEVELAWTCLLFRIRKQFKRPNIIILQY